MIALFPAEWMDTVSPDKTAADNKPPFFLPDLCNLQSVLVLVLLSGLLALLRVLLRSGLGFFDWPDFALTSLFLLWSSLGSAGLLCKARPWLSPLPLPLSASLSYLLILMVVALTSLIGQWLTRDLLAGASWRPSGLLLLEHLLVAAVLAGIALRYAYLAQQLQLRQRGELSARLEALQARIRPHFLFNSLNSIASLVTAHPETAEQAVEDLAALFRASLKEIRAEVSWAEEYELCQRYLRIEALRLGSRLQLDWQVEALPDDLRLPSLSLQPLLENAIAHGIAELPGGGTIGIRASVKDGCARIQVSNPLPDNRPASGNHMAVENIHHRLQGLYGERAGLQVRCEGRQFVAEMVLRVEGLQ